MCVCVVTIIIIIIAELQTGHWTCYLIALLRRGAVRKNLWTNRRTKENRKENNSNSDIMSKGQAKERQGESERVHKKLL